MEQIRRRVGDDAPQQPLRSPTARGRAANAGDRVHEPTASSAPVVSAASGSRGRAKRRRSMRSSASHDHRGQRQRREQQVERRRVSDGGERQQRDVADARAPTTISATSAIVSVENRLASPRLPAHVDDRADAQQQRDGDHAKRRPPMSWCASARAPREVGRRHLRFEAERAVATGDDEANTDVGRRRAGVAPTRSVDRRDRRRHHERVAEARRGFGACRATARRRRSSDARGRLRSTTGSTRIRRGPSAPGAMNEGRRALDALARQIGDAAGPCERRAGRVVDRDAGPALVVGAAACSERGRTAADRRA